MLRATLIGVLATSFLTGVAAESLEKSNDVTSNGLHGPVHTQRVTTRKLEKDPRSTQKLNFWWSPVPWMVFDRRGRLVEQSNRVKADGTPEGITRIEHDSQGRVVEERQEAADGTVWRSEYRYGPFGVVETKNFRGDELENWTETDYDEAGHEIAGRRYDASGKLVNRFSWLYNKGNHEVEQTVTHLNDDFESHTIMSYDPEGDLASWDELDAEGRIIRSVAFRKGQIISWWQEPGCKCSGMGTVSTDPEKGVSIGYQIQSDRPLETVIENHPGRKGNLENDEMQLFSENGELLERITFRYQRDGYGSWITRVISAWNPETDTMVPIQEDRREISYYQ